MLMEHVNAPARWWPCACLRCVSGLRKLEKTSNFLRCIHVFDLVLKYGSDINEGNWLQLLFYFIVLIGKVVSGLGMTFFRLCLRFWIEIFYCTLTETVAIGFQKWFDHEWTYIVVFCWKMASFVEVKSVWTETKKCSFVILFWRHHFFLMFRLRGILVCSLNVLQILLWDFAISIDKL